jgi:hypothetical protein
MRLTSRACRSPLLDDLVAVDEIDDFVQSDRGIDMRGLDPDKIANSRPGAVEAAEGGVLVGAEPDLGVVDGGQAVVQAQRFEPRVGDGPVRRGGFLMTCSAMCAPPTPV